MITVENVETWGFEHAIRGMRNPMNSWDKSDSDFSGRMTCIGDKDIELMQRLYKAGTEHRKYLRQIFVSVDITAPLYWWKEFDTYKVGTVANSCSTMHKIADKEFELDDFSHEHLYTDRLSPYCSESMLSAQIAALNFWRRRYSDTKNKSDWWQMIQLLPSSYNQRRTITMNYENVVMIINQRKHHKLDEWRDLVSVLENLPYIEDIVGNYKEK